MKHMTAVTTAFTHKHTCVSAVWLCDTSLASVPGSVQFTNSMPVVSLMKDCFGEEDLPSMCLVPHEIESTILSLMIYCYRGHYSIVVAVHGVYYLYHCYFDHHCHQICRRYHHLFHLFKSLVFTVFVHCLAGTETHTYSCET